VKIETGRIRTKGTMKLGPDEEIEFSLMWVRLELSEVQARKNSSLVITSSGKKIEIGKFLFEQERREFSVYLKRWLLTH